MLASTQQAGLIRTTRSGRSTACSSATSRVFGRDRTRSFSSTCWLRLASRITSWLWQGKVRLAVYRSEPVDGSPTKVCLLHSASAVTSRKACCSFPPAAGYEVTSGHSSCSPWPRGRGLHVCNWLLHSNWQVDNALHQGLHQFERRARLPTASPGLARRFRYSRTIVRVHAAWPARIESLDFQLESPAAYRIWSDCAAHGSVPGQNLCVLHHA